MLKQFRVADDIAVRIDAAAMRRTVDEIFRALGMPAEDAQRSVDCLLYADERGIDSHGVSNMMRSYVSRLQEGLVNPRPRLQLLREARAVAVLDSDRGLGLTIGPQAMAIAIEKARQCGVGTVIATNGAHFGADRHKSNLSPV